MYGRPAPHRRDLDFVVSVDLGQAQDYTAVSIVERRIPASFDQDTLEVITAPAQYQVVYLDRVPLGTRYPVIVAEVLSLLDRRPLTRDTPLVVDRTGVGAPIADLFAEAGVEPQAITIHGGDTVTSEYRHHRVPKRDLVHTLLQLYQSERFKTVEGLALFPVFLEELLNFQSKVNINTAHESFESWRESIHDDLVLSISMAVWFWENQAERHMPVTEETRQLLRRLYDPDAYLR